MLIEVKAGRDQEKIGYDKETDVFEGTLLCGYVD